MEFDTPVSSTISDDNHMPGCNNDSHDMQLILQKSNRMLSSKDIRPYPKVGPRSASIKGRKKRKSRILTENHEKMTGRRKKQRKKTF